MPFDTTTYSPLTAEQLEVLAKLDAYPHEFFDLTKAWGEPNCFRCIAGAIGDARTSWQFMQESERLFTLCGVSSAAKTRMTNLTGYNYGRKVPGVRDYPPERVPKAVAIKAVREIFEMAQAEKMAVQSNG